MILGKVKNASGKQKIGKRGPEEAGKVDNVEKVSSTTAGAPTNQCRQALTTSVGWGKHYRIWVGLAETKKEKKGRCETKMGLGDGTAIK